MNQNLICDYLNIQRVTKGLSKKDLVQKVPSSYKHTFGYWLRKDMSGSLPKMEDVFVLKDILDLNENYVQYINTFGRRLQTVMANKKGKKYTRN